MPQRQKRWEAVHNNRTAQRSSAHEETAHFGDFKTAQTLQHVERRLEIRTVQRESSLDSGDFCKRQASSAPVPRPITSATGLPLSAAAMAAAEVVLAIPISPQPSRL